MPRLNRELQDLFSVGNAMLRDFEMLGIRSVAQLARANPRRLYERLCEITRAPQDICVYDALCAAVAQARNPRLPAAQRRWWYYSRLRKKHEARES
jgi:hypothetical protein